MGVVGGGWLDVWGLEGFKRGSGRVCANGGFGGWGANLVVDRGVSIWMLAGGVRTGELIDVGRGGANLVVDRGVPIWMLAGDGQRGW